MLKRKIRTLAVTGITTVAAALVTLSTTAASAATTTASAPGHVAAPRAAEVTGCVAETFVIGDENTYEPCVRDEQILLNDLRYRGVPGLYLQLLTVDGYYGSNTTADVRSYQGFVHITVDGKTGPVTWENLCYTDWFYGFRGTYWQNAGCNQFDFVI